MNLDASMCSLHDFLRKRLESTLPSEDVRFTRAGLQEALDLYRCAAPVECAAFECAGDHRTTWRVEELAREIGIGASTLRAALAAGQFGDPAALRVGRRFVIPGALAARVLSHLREGGRLADLGSPIEGDADGPSREPLPSTIGVTAPPTAPATATSPATPTTKARRAPGGAERAIRARAREKAPASVRSTRRGGYADRRDDLGSWREVLAPPHGP